MKDRIITGTVLALTLLLVIWSRVLTPYIFDFFMGAFTIVAIIEVARVLEKRQIVVNTLVLGCYPAIFFVGLAIGLANKLGYIYYFAYVLLSMVAVFILNFVLTLCMKNTTNREKERYGIYSSDVEYAFQKAMNSELVLIYPGLLGCLMFVVNHFMEFNSISAGLLGQFDILSTFIIVLLFVITIFTDTFALIVGSFIGGKKLCPRISPKKTISGAVGGLIFATLAGMVTFYIFYLFPEFKELLAVWDIAVWQIVVISFVASMMGQIGDLAASMLKRSSRVKDYGTLLPGHGGVMDRIDGLLFVIPVVVLAMFILVL